MAERARLDGQTARRDWPLAIRLLPAPRCRRRRCWCWRCRRRRSRRRTRSPTGGMVVAGGASIAQSATTTTIDQASQRAAINWQSFNVGASKRVTFAQPSASAVALNRVTGPDPSQIAGRIDANGQIVLGQPGRGDVLQGRAGQRAEFDRHPANITEREFHGRQAWCSTSRAIQTRAVVNAGTITVKQAGLAALVAPRVANPASSTRELGHVVLAGAKTDDARSVRRRAAGAGRQQSGHPGAGRHQR